MKEDESAQNLLDDHQPGRRKWIDSLTGSWRTTVWLGAGLTILILLINLTLLIWTGRTSAVIDGVATVFEGSCDRTRNIALSTHLLINIFSTILLGASNNCAQLLCAPTRHDLTKAHAKGLWLDIGVPSMRNLRSIPYWRSLLWAMLMISSLPLHLLYNSVIFETSSTHLYQATVVTEAFLDGGWWNESQVNEYASQLGNDFDRAHLHDFQDNVAQLRTLNNYDCIKQFGSGDINPTRGNVIVVTSYDSNDTVIGSYGQEVSDSHWSGREWICDSNTSDYQYDAKVRSTTGGFCNMTTLSRDARNWTPMPPLPWWRRNTSLDYFWEPPLPPHCTIKISMTILIIIIICNISKAVCLILTACGKFRPLATIGDAIASFLEDRDDAMQGMGSSSKSDIKQNHRRVLSQHVPVAPQYKAKMLRWKDSVSTKGWYLCIALCFVTIIAAIVPIVFGIRSSRSRSGYPASRLFADFGGALNASESGSIINMTAGLSLVANVLITNLPQLIVSLIYHWYNDILTCMLLAHEYAGYATKHKCLRVNRPVGQQRSTYRLQLPYKYIIPLMSTMTILHWLISRSTFLVQIVVYGYDNQIRDRDAVSSCGFAVLPLLLAAILELLIVVALLCLSRRKLTPGIPMAGSCSLAIGAACANTLETDAATKPVQYGVLQRPPDAEGLQYVGFSAQAVTPLQDDVKYL